MKILHATEVALGGAITAMDSLIAGQAQAPHVTQVLRLCAADLTCRPHPAIRQIPYRRTGRNAGSQLALAAALVRTLLRERPDIVHLHSTFAGVWGRLLALLLSWRGRWRVVYTPHGFAFLPQSRFRRAYGVAERLLARACQAIVCVSEYERGAALRHGLPADKLRVIHNGVPAQPDCAKAQDDHLRALFVGRFDRIKGFDVLLQALALLGPRPSITFRAVGAPDNDDLGGLDGAHGLHCLGWMDARALADQYRWADVVVVPSRSEGFAMVPLEGMSFGCAVVASDCTSLPEAVEDGITGRIVPAGDPQALAAALAAAVPAELRAMGQAGARRQRQRFQLAGTVAATLSLYDALLGHRSRSPAPPPPAGVDPAPPTGTRRAGR